MIVLDRLYIYWMETTGRGWVMWCGSWMDVYGECGVIRRGGRLGMCVFMDGDIWGMGAFVD